MASLTLPSLPPSTFESSLSQLLQAQSTSNSPSYHLPHPPTLDADPFSSLLRPLPSTSNLSPQPPPTQSSLTWLKTALPSTELYKKALRILTSPSSDGEIVESLLELWGYEGIEKVGEAVSKRGEIGTEVAEEERKASVPVEPTYNSKSGTKRAPTTTTGGRRDHTPSSQITFRTPEELAEQKRFRKAARHKGKFREEEEDMELDLEDLERIREEALRRGPGPLVSGKRKAVGNAEQYPHVYLSTASSTSGNLSIGGSSLAMPVGTTKEDKGEYEEILIPAPKAVPFRFNEALLPIGNMDLWGQRTFHAYKTLNRLQSIVFPVAYNTNENMLVCAPTGAGKTDVALLTILRCLSSLTSTPLTNKTASPTLPPASTYKIIYVAPLKALAAEITAKFAKRLSWAGVKVRELTGDMKLTRKEVDETGVIVTTPEKWDVVTRRGAGAGDGDVADKVKLLIIDEVHLLHEDRGAVIESIVARTLRHVESSQTPIRIVGLSATLPNYVDVADFLRVNRYQGLFYFDASFRPVPLEQHFVGVKGKSGTLASRAGLDKVAFEKVSELVRQGHQVMVFVHARKDTVKTSEMLKEKAQGEDMLDLLDPRDHERWFGFKKEMASSRNREMKDLAESGFGIHHAGMLRSDRNITERMFEANVTKVLCCTATLAWGVNLPAYAVIIKGTQIYDSGKGCFVDLSILDVLQIFGRAGRPQYEDQGVGYICTSNDKLDHYVSAISQQHPIESKFVEGLVDALNAEISLGTVSNLDEGVRWLGYSYLFVRMRKNPLVYGMKADEVVNDPLLGSKRLALIRNSTKRLLETQMVKFDEVSGSLEATDLGRIASRYYIRNASIEVFNNLFRPRMSEADVLALIAASTEFAQITVRENEVVELLKLIEIATPCQVKGGTESSAGKVNVLLQAYISRAYVEDFALVSDLGYVAQNAARIVRALLEIAMAKRWAPVTLVLMAMSKAIEKRMWPFKHPLGQFDLPSDLMYNIERWADDLGTTEIASMSDADFGALVHQNERLGGFATTAARQVPTLTVEHSLQPVSHDLLRIRLVLRPQFEWSEKRHGTTEAFWVWIEDEESLSILQVARILVRPTTTTVHQTFVVPISAQAPSALHVRVVSDRWFGTEEEAHDISLEHLAMPPEPPPHLPLLDLPLLSPRDAFADPRVQSIYAADSPVFDPVQTQSFHSMYHTSSNTLVCTPSAPSRGALLELAVWRAFAINPLARIIFVAPDKALARNIAVRLKRVFGAILRLTPLILTRPQDLASLPAANKPFIAVCAPSISSAFLAKPARLADLDLIAAHDLHALDAPYELLLSRLRWAHPMTRIVASSSSLQDSTDLADWLGVPPTSVYSFSPSTRSSALASSFQSFSAPQSAGLLHSMTKPAYDAIRTASGPALCFVPSRAQARATAKDLVTQTAIDLDESFILPGMQEMVEAYAQTVLDPSHAEALLHGIAVFHEGLKPSEQQLALELFGGGAVKVLIASREACWTLPLRASLVVVMSAQFLSVNREGDRELRDYALPELLQMQSLARPSSADAAAKFLVLCQKEQAELYNRFLLQGVPLESEFDGNALLQEMVYQDLVAGRLETKQDVVESLSWTFLARRLDSNPAYYQSSSTNTNDRISRVADGLLADLEACCSVIVHGSTSKLEMSAIGKVASDQGHTLDDLRRIQDIELDRLVELTKPKTNGKGSDSVSSKEPASALDLTPSEATKPVEIGPLVNFYQRLPRAVRDRIGRVCGNEEDSEFRRKTLLAAFAAGRVPRGTGGEGLGKEQADLVGSLLSRKK